MSDGVHISISDRCHSDDRPPESIIKIFKLFWLCFRFNGVHDKGGGDEKGEENKDDREDIILFFHEDGENDINSTVITQEFEYPEDSA